MPVLDSLASMISSFQNDGAFNRYIHAFHSGSTQANATSGRINCTRMPQQITIPTLPGGVKGVRFTNIHGIGNTDRCHVVVGIEYVFGTYNCSTNVYTDNGQIGTREVEGDVIQPATILNFVTVSANVTGTPALTITYTNQDGTINRTASVTTPAGPIANSAFLLNRHMQGGDSGIRRVTNITETGATAGTIEVRGLLPLKILECWGSGSSYVPVMMDAAMPNWLALSGDKITIYKMGDGVTAGGTMASIGLYGLAER